MPRNVAVNWSWGFISGNNFLFISVGAWVKQPKGVLEGLDGITFISLYVQCHQRVFMSLRSRFFTMFKEGDLTLAPWNNWVEFLRLIL